MTLLKIDSFSDDAYLCCSSSAHLNHLCIFLLKVKICSSTISNHSSLSARSSSPSSSLHSSCNDINSLVKSLICSISSSTVTLFLLEYNKSSTALHFLVNLEYVFSLLCFNKEILYSSPFDVGFLNLWPLPRSSY